MDKEWEILTTVGSEEEAALVVGLLRSQGIPSRTDSRLMPLYPVPASKLGDVHVLVPLDRLDQGRKLLEATKNLAHQAEEEYDKEDFDREED